MKAGSTATDSDLRVSRRDRRLFGDRRSSVVPNITNYSRRIAIKDRRIGVADRRIHNHVSVSSQLLFGIQPSR